MDDKKYQELNNLLMKTVKEFAKEKGGISFYDLGGLLSQGEVYAALSKEPVFFTDSR